MNPTMNTASHIEPLESRIAPATLVNARTVTYFDGDGDKVTVTISKGTFENPNTPGQTTWTFGPSATGIAGREQLELLDLSFFAQFDGASLSIVAVPVATGPTAGGDGTVSVGHIDATGIDLGAVVVRGDVGAIDAGDNILTDGSIKALTVLSLGGDGLTSGATDLKSNIKGSVGSIRVIGDISNAEVRITDGSLASLYVGGSIFGGAAADSGSIDVAGTITAAYIGGDLLGGGGAAAGSLTAARIGTLTVGGSIYGGGGVDSGLVSTSSFISKITVGGDVVGSDGEGSGVISADAIGTVTIDGSVIGGLGEASGRVEVANNLTTLRIGGSLLGGSLLGVSSEKAGTIFVGGKLTTAVVGGNIEGGNAQSGFTNSETGYVLAGQIGAMALGGSLIGGSDNGGSLFDSGTIRSLGTITSLTIKGGMFGGSSRSGGDTNGSAYIEADRLGAVSIGGTIFAGSDAGTLSNSGAIRAHKDIGTLIVKGSLEGTATHPVIISAVGQPTPTGTTDLAIRAISILGRGFQAEILAGYSPDTSGSIFGKAVNADAQIGSIGVGGNWIASDIIAGLSTGGDGFFGDAADTKINTVGATDSAARISKIATIVIGGRVLGDSTGSAVRNGIGAQFIGVLRVGGVTNIPLIAGAGTDTFAGVNGAYPLGQTLGTFPTNPSFNMHAFEVAV